MFKRISVIFFITFSLLLFYFAVSSLINDSFAYESASSNFRITRSAVNCGGGEDKTSSGNNYRMAADSAGEISSNTLTSTSYRLPSGLANVYYYPGTITDLACATGDFSGEITVNWTAPDVYGSTFNYIYVIKYHADPGTIDDPINTQQKFFDATEYVHTWKPLDPNADEDKTLTGLNPGTTYWIAIEARDNGSNQGYLCNQVYAIAQSAILGVDIDTTTYGFGQVSMDSFKVSTGAITVENTGTISSTWSICAATITANSPWQLTTGAVADNLFRLSAGFNATKPNNTDFGAEDRLTPAPAMSTDTGDPASAFSTHGSQTGYNVSPLSGQDQRTVWFLIETPVHTSTTQQQDIQVTVTANE